MNWTSPCSKDSNYVTIYVSYNPSCPELSSVNMILVPVIPHESTSTFSYALRELSSGVNYTITVSVSNLLSLV